MLPNVVAQWEFILATMKLGAVVSPASMLLSDAELTDRITRGDMQYLITDTASVPKFVDAPGHCTRIVVGEPTSDWVEYSYAGGESDEFSPRTATHARDPFLLYFTSGTTAKPKMVVHTFESYPVGHLSTMYWIGHVPGTSTGTSVLPAGPSMLGAPSLRRGTPGQPSISTINLDSRPQRYYRH